ncbi:MAG: hypothetical protein ACJ789_21475 [Thermomicrobiales bacterium]
MLVPFETFFTRRNQEVMSMVVPTITGPNRHWRLLRLAEIWPPYDPAGSVIVGTKPLGPEEIHQVEEQGFTVVAETPDQSPYSHVISTGTHDYLALLEEVE